MVHAEREKAKKLREEKNEERIRKEKERLEEQMAKVEDLDDDQIQEPDNELDNEAYVHIDREKKSDKCVGVFRREVMF